MLVLGAIPAGFVQQIHRAEAAAGVDDGNIEHRSEPNTENDLIVVKDGSNIIGSAAEEHLLVAQHVIRPRRRVLPLAAAGWIGRWHVAVDALHLGARAVEAHDREQPMPDYLGAERFQRRAD